MKKHILFIALLLNLLFLSDMLSSSRSAVAASEPEFLFPWDHNKNPKYFTGGPHTTFGNIKSAIDFSGGQYQAISIEAGVVAFAGHVSDRPLEEDKSSGSWSGDVVVITHDNGIQSEYWHLNRVEPLLSIGSRIPRGHPIGWSGCTGDGAKYPFGDENGKCVNHLHIDFRTGGARDPKNGAWKRGDPVDVTSIVLDGWNIQAATTGGWDRKGSYNGTMTKANESIRSADRLYCEEKTPGCLRDLAYEPCPEITHDCIKIRNDLQSSNVIAIASGTETTSPQVILNARLAALPKFPILEPGQTAQVQIDVKNIGSTAWPAGGRVILANHSGEALGATSSQLSESVSPDAQRTIVLTITAPEKPGFYSGIWRMKLDNQPFGYPIPVAVAVVPKGSSDGLKGILQQVLDDARQQLTNKLDQQFEKAWEDFKRAVEKRIEEEINRQVDRTTGGLCGTTPAGIALVGGISIFWRRKKRRATFL